MKRKSIRNKLALAALLLALMSSATTKAYGQIDEFYSSGINGGHWDGFGFGTIDDNENNENIGTWTNFQQDDPTPIGGGLLVLAASGVCYAAFKRRPTTQKKGKEK